MSNPLALLAEPTSSVGRCLSCRLEPPMLVAVRKNSCGKVMFLHLSVSHSVHKGWCTSPSPWADTHWVNTPLGRHPPPRDGLCSGRYASYWNALLFVSMWRSAGVPPQVNLRFSLRTWISGPRKSSKLLNK